MTSSLALTDKESFDNYLDYKDEIEFRLIKKIDSDDSEVIDLAVVKEMYTMDLINYEFYMKQIDNVKTIYEYQKKESSRLCSLKTLILFGTVSLLAYLIFNKYDEINKTDL